VSSAPPRPPPAPPRRRHPGRVPAREPRAPPPHAGRRGTPPRRPPRRFCSVTYFAPNFVGEAPRWAYLFNAFAVTAYMHLDCVDGKQARRTGSSTPLGQLFDHGCDALTTYFVVYSTLAAAQVGMSALTLAGVVAAFVVWVMGHWEEYHTGTMFYGTGWYGLTESLYTIALIQLLTGLFGASLWTAPLWSWPGLRAAWPAVSAALRFAPSLAGLGFPPAAALTTGQAATLASMVGCAPLVHGNVTRVLAGPALPEEERGHKALGRAAAVRHLLWFVLLFAEGAVFINQRLAYEDPWVAQCLCATLGVAFALQATRLIVAHMCKVDFWPDKASPALLALGIANEFFPVVDARLAVYAVGAGTLLVYVHYVAVTISEITSFLGIRAFSIAPRPAGAGAPSRGRAPSRARKSSPARKSSAGGSRAASPAPSRGRTPSRARKSSAGGSRAASPAPSRGRTPSRARKSSAGGAKTPARSRAASPGAPAASPKTPRTRSRSARK